MSTARTPDGTPLDEAFSRWLVAYIPAGTLNLEDARAAFVAGWRAGHDQGIDATMGWLKI